MKHNLNVVANMILSVLGTIRLVSMNVSCYRLMECHVLLQTVALHQYCPVATQIYETFLSYLANYRFINYVTSFHQHP